MSWSELVSATKNLIICINQKIMQFKQRLEHFALITIKKDVWPYCTYMYAELKIWTFLNLLFCAKNINKTIFRWLKQQMIWCLTCCFYANCTLKYKTLSFNYLEMCSFRFKYIDKKFKMSKKVVYVYSPTICWEKDWTKMLGRIFIKEYMYLEKNSSSQTPFGRKSCNLCGSIIKYIDNFATYISCYLLRSGQFLALTSQFKKCLHYSILATLKWTSKRA